MSSLTSGPSGAQDLDPLCVNTIRFLSIDAVQKANSGHPGMPMGAAPMAYVLWTRFLRHSPASPAWFDRDRFVLSAGHGSMLLYSLLHLTGYDLPLDEITRFRQWGSVAVGHPERGVTPGVEVTTGPLGQGFANAVGMAIAEAHLAARYNRPGFEIIDHHTYVLASDGDLMEGVGAEAASLAGHLKLGKLVCLYDDNRITLAGAASLAFTEDRAARFAAYGWQTLAVDDGNDLEAIDEALRAARNDTERPSLVLVRTRIGYGAPHKQDTFEAHGSPLGEDEVRLTKQALGWPVEPPFFIPDAALARFREAVERGRRAEQQWNARFAAYAQAHPEPAAEIQRMIRGELPPGWEQAVPAFPDERKAIATRVASGRALNALAARVPGLIGGSADLNPSTFTALEGMGDFEHPQRSFDDTQGSSGGGWSYAGRNLHFGVREHAMGAILNGIAAHGGLIPFGATFLTFSDYMRPPIRLAAMMGLGVIYVFTHDSIGLGEDGPTHQPIEQLLGLRAVPGLVVLRPADANETAAAWRIAMEERTRPVALVLTRQKAPVLDPQRFPHLAEGVRAGAYVLADAPQGVEPAVVIAATGSEVHLALAAHARLADDGIPVRVVSVPSWSLLERQPAEYRRRIAPPEVPLVAIEAGATLGWRPYLGPQATVIGLDQFGASAPAEVLFREYGFTVDRVCREVRNLLRGARPKVDRVGVATDHGGFALKEEIVRRLRAAGYHVLDFGAHELAPDDDYPDYVAPLAQAVAKGDVARGIAVCGSGVGASVVANKVHGVRAGLVHDAFSARQGVEDDDMNVLCLGGRVVGVEAAWLLVKEFLEARFVGKDRYVRRLEKVKALE